jgi:PIN domain nuclease of toxin-antitoxin system
VIALFDSNALYWALFDPKVLKPSFIEQSQTGQLETYISLATVWEFELKHAKGKLRLPIGWLDQARKDGFVLTDIKVEDIQTSTRLPFHHRDPFDRLLVAQAKRLKAHLVTRDHLLGQYGIPIVEA